MTKDAVTKDAVTKDGHDKPRVLIVEDDSAIAAGLRLNLRHEGYVVTVEADGEQGLKRALQDVPDLVILDVMLPTMNGFEVLRELRRRGNTAGIIMLTAKGLEEDKVLTLASAWVLSHLIYFSPPYVSSLFLFPPSLSLPYSWSPDLINRHLSLHVTSPHLSPHHSRRATAPHPPRRMRRM